MEFGEDHWASFKGNQILQSRFIAEIKGAAFKCKLNLASARTIEAVLFFYELIRRRNMF
jgi:hypothetical protein